MNNHIIMGSGTLATQDPDKQGWTIHDDEDVQLRGLIAEAEALNPALSGELADAITATANSAKNAGDSMARLAEALDRQLPPRRFRYRYKGPSAKFATSIAVGLYMVHCCLIHGAEPNEKAIHLLRTSKRWRIRKKQIVRLQRHIKNLERG